MDNFNSWIDNEVHNMKVVKVDMILTGALLSCELVFVFLRHPDKEMKIYLYSEDIVNALRMFNISSLSDLVGTEMRVKKHGDIKIGHKTLPIWV